MESKGKTAFNEGEMFFNSGDYGKAEVRFRRAAKLCCEYNNRQGEEVSLGGLADSLRFQHKWKEALGVLDKQMRPLTAALFKERSDQYDTYLRCVVECRVNMKQYGEARKLADRRCELTKDLHGEESAQHGDALRQVGTVLRSQGDNAGAMKYYERAKLPKEHANYGPLINDMATAHEDLGEFDRALPLRQKHLEIARQRYDDQHPHYATTLFNLAFLYGKLKRFDLAVEHLTKALEIYERKLGPTHPNTIDTRECIAMFQRALKDETVAMQIASNKRMCHACGKVPNDHYYTCSRCLHATYCSETCQHAHWPEHGKACVQCINGCAAGCGKGRDGARVRCVPWAAVLLEEVSGDGLESRPQNRM
jgi:tetratricopeptide (TPR) repeat protein